MDNSRHSVLHRIRRDAREVGIRFSARMRRWMPVIAKFMMVQAAVQGLSLLTGILIVRSLEKSDYALYTLANSGLSALMALSNSGISYGVTAIGGRVWQDSRQLGRVVGTALSLRTRLALIVAAPTAAILLWLLRENGATTEKAATLLALVLTTGLFQLTYGILVVVPQLRGQVRAIQYLDLAAATLRLVLIAVAALLYLDVRIVLLVGTVVSLLQFYRMRYLARTNIDITSPPDPTVATEMKMMVKRQWPNEVHYVFQGQIYVFLLSVFGTPESVADLGALSRISIVFSILVSVMQAIVLPRYARHKDVRRLPKFHLAIFCGYTTAAAIPVLFVWLFSRQLLWVLGQKYAGLDLQLVMVAASGALGSTAGIAWALNATRGWIIPGWIAVPIGLALQVAIMAIVGTSTFYQVVTVGILSNVTFTLIHLAASVAFMWRLRRAASVVSQRRTAE